MDENFGEFEKDEIETNLLCPSLLTGNGYFLKDVFEISKLVRSSLKKEEYDEDMICLIKIKETMENEEFGIEKIFSHAVNIKKKKKINLISIFIQFFFLNKIRLLLLIIWNIFRQLILFGGY